MLDLAIQIINYKTKKYLSDCIDGVLNDLKDSDLNFKIFILDNNSGDNLKDLEEKYKGREIEFFYSDINGGFGAGHNILAQKAEGKYILILNPDIIFLEPKTISRLLDDLNKNEKIKVIGPKLITEKKEAQWWDHGEIVGFNAWLANLIGRSYFKERYEKIKVAWVSGAFFLIDREIFKDLSGFDKKFFLYKEEEDLCLQIRKLGFEILYDGEVRVMHYGSVVASKDEFMQASNDYFIKKHFSGKFYYSILKLFSRIVVK